VVILFSKVKLLKWIGGKKMKIGISATGPSIDDGVDQRFGRCPYYIIVDNETNDVKSIENPNVSQPSGAGISSAQLMANEGVKVILTGNCGPKAYQVFDAAGIEVITGVSGSVREAIEKYKAGKLKSQGMADDYKVGTPFEWGRGMGRGIGRGMGGGRGLGGGRGMGRGMGRCWSTGFGGSQNYSAAPSPAFTNAEPAMQADVSLPQTDREKEIEALKKKLQALEARLEQLKGGAPREMAPGKGTPIVAEVDRGQCQGCGLCQEVCPEGAISVNEYATVNVAMCVGCGECVAACPEGAIFLRKA